MNYCFKIKDSLVSKNCDKLKNKDSWNCILDLNLGNKLDFDNKL